MDVDDAVAEGGYRVSWQYPGAQDHPKSAAMPGRNLRNAGISVVDRIQWGD
jgi:hypothetical protein